MGFFINLVFIVAVSWYTVMLISPFLSLIYLIQMATALTQGKKITYLMAGLAISSYILMKLPRERLP
jgi:hypothetical protein